MLDADLVIGAVLVPGAAAPKLVTREMVRRDEAGLGAGRHRDRPGRLLRDQPATTHADPTYVDEGVVHYCVTNMPGAVAADLDLRAQQRDLPFVLALADKGWRKAFFRTISICVAVSMFTRAPSLSRPWRRTSRCPSSRPSWRWPEGRCLAPLGLMEFEGRVVLGDVGDHLDHRRGVAGEASRRASRKPSAFSTRHAPTPKARA